ncbi:MAG: type II toxin-antitoxin system HicA family toxin [Leptospiraceae bacterium]|nr:type II toxin-antitoxin system HicA family toxin [Leptospiraceae bacterium]
MSRLDKLKLRFLKKPQDFSFSELVTLLAGLGYEKENLGKTSGSRVAFINHGNKHIIRIHKPHPGNILKAYQVNLILDELKSKGEI